MTLFGKSTPKPTAKEQCRQMKRDLNKEKRSVDRDILGMEREEKKLLTDIKTAAKKGDDHQAKLLAKQIVQLRKTRERMQQTNARLGGIQAQATNMQATAALGETLKTTTGIMTQMNKQMNIPELQETMKQMQQEHARAEMKDEMITDMFDMMDPDDMEDEMDGEVGKVMDELALDAMGKVPILRQAQATSSAEADLDKRLADLNV
eukprot:GEMP01097211.1.p1 GENE.GEMP01097211.1~~GEMP01097211.1.p1  ORF type:complete len:206 (+),score=57.25 GEMP01097211.1:105-722(+)